MVTQVEPGLAEKLKALDILSPVDEDMVVLWSAAREVKGFSGLRMGFLGNTWANTERVLGHVKEMFERAYDLKGTVLMNKPVHTRPAPPEMIEELAEQCDLVITGTGG